MEQRGGAYFLVGIMIVMLIMVIASVREPNVEAKLLPLLFASAALILCAIELVRSRSQRRKPLPLHEGN